MLLLIFFATLIIGLAGLWAFSLSLKALGFSSPSTLAECIHIALFFTSLTFAYIVTYTALQVDSPSITMVMQIDNAGPDGYGIMAFTKMMTDDILVKPRIRDLVTAELACVDGDKYRLTRKGILLAGVFIYYRKLMNYHSKGG
jgi:hypothetical protein